MEMRYALALYCSDLTDSRKDLIPVGVLVVDEKAQRYAFKNLEHFSHIFCEDDITMAIWQSIPEILEQRFEKYCKNPSHDLYKDRAKEYHGFISQMIDEWSQSSIYLSDSMPLEGSDDIEKRTQILFKEKVLRKLD
ncbi:MAG: hypothetical protein Q7S55_05275 [Nanoarchaeota archaeon]|nr:hypothetical protein [Nanoarchaeota archaeon]